MVRIGDAVMRWCDFFGSNESKAPHLCLMISIVKGCIHICFGVIRSNINGNFVVPGPEVENGGNLHNFPKIVEPSFSWRYVYRETNRLVMIQVVFLVSLERFDYLGSGGMIR